MCMLNVQSVAHYPFQNIKGTSTTTKIGQMDWWTF